MKNVFRKSSAPKTLLLKGAGDVFHESPGIGK
jgi:hypothetical protein